LKFLKWYPDMRDTRKRIILSTLSYMAITATSVTPLIWLYSKIPVFEFSMDNFTHGGVVVVSMVTNIIITIIFEALAAFERWKATLYETEQLKKENLKSQLQSLKDQINPHFLFNSINSLSSLIAEDPEKAEQFLDEMSKVYRYLLRNNEDNLISLSDELQFINSYYHLLKTRYGEAINLILKVPPNCQDSMLPPLTLQILVENAVKHNIISKELPLNIEIICENNKQLIVKNNLQRKTAKVLSNQVGLENIAAKYHLLNQPDLLVKEENNEFVVQVPLIQKERKMPTA
jgi:LytS/YehU family sensor histidine kinase